VLLGCLLLEIHWHDDVHEVVIDAECSGFVGCFELEDDLFGVENFEGIEDELWVEADLDLIAFVIFDLDINLGFACLGCSAGEAQRCGIAIGFESHAYATGFFGCEQGGAPEGAAEDLDIEYRSHVLLFGDDIVVGGEGTFDECACDCRDGRIAVFGQEREERLVVDDGDVNRG